MEDTTQPGAEALDLLPCPFCGSPAAALPLSAYCTNLDCGASAIPYDERKGGGVESWNRRATPTHAVGAPSNWTAAVEWLRNNYQDHANVASLCDAMIAATPPASQACGEPAPIPDGVYFNPAEDNFYNAAGFGMGTAFFRKWQMHADKFPTTHEQASATPPATTAAPEQDEICENCARPIGTQHSDSCIYSGEISPVHMAARTESAAAPERSDKPAEPYGYAVEQRDGHVTFFKEDPKGFRHAKWAEVGTKVIELIATQPTPSGKALPAQEGEQA